MGRTRRSRRAGVEPPVREERPREWWEREGDAVRLRIRVQPRASRAGVGPVRDGRLVVRVCAPPVGGAANRAVTELIARELGARPSDVTIERGHGAREKTVRVAHPGRDPGWLPEASGD